MRVFSQILEFKITVKQTLVLICSSYSFVFCYQSVRMTGESLIINADWWYVFLCVDLFSFFNENMFLSYTTQHNHSFLSHYSFKFPLTSLLPQIYFPSIPFIKDHVFKRQQWNKRKQDSIRQGQSLHRENEQCNPVEEKRPNSRQKSQRYTLSHF